MIGSKYDRKHLRAPCISTVLFADDDYVFKTEMVNISEGGMLLKGLPHFPQKDIVPMMIRLPFFPPFINFSLQKMKDFTFDVFSPKILRIKAHMVRRVGETTNVDDVFKSRLGIQFDLIDTIALKQISDYVMTFTNNIVFLQTLLEQANSDEEAMEKAKVLASILGYNSNVRISELKMTVGHDYKSLQWL